MADCITSWPALLRATARGTGPTLEAVDALESRVATLAYFWGVQRCGIHARVEQGRVTLTPFLNPNFKNTWGALLRFALPGGCTPCSAAEYFAARAACDARYVPLPLAAWWAGAGVLASETGPWVHQWDGALPRVLGPLREMLEAAAACADGAVEFMLNPRDAPQVGAAARVSAPFLPGPRLRACRFRRPSTPLLPCASFYGSREHDDVLLPPVADWTGSAPMRLPPWASRARAACFYGSATGAGVTPGTNQRLAFAEAARTGPLAVRLVCGITSWNARDKVVVPADGDGAGAVVSCIAPETLPFGLAPWTSLEAQAAAHRYLVYIPGHAAASRLGALLRTGCLVLRVDALPGVAGVHWLDAYIRGARAPPAAGDCPDYLCVDADLGNLAATLDWADTHEAEAEAIATRGAAHAEIFLSKGFIARHVACALGLRPA